MLKRKSESSLNCYSKLKFWVSGFTLTLVSKCTCLKLRGIFYQYYLEVFFDTFDTRKKFELCPSANQRRLNTRTASCLFTFFKK